MATLTREAVTEDGLTATGASASGGGDQFLNTGVEWLYVTNDDATSTTVTITAQDVQVTLPGFGDLDKSDRVVVVAAGATAHIGLFPKTAFNDASGYVQITYSKVTSLNVAVLYHTGV